MLQSSAKDLLSQLSQVIDSCKEEDFARPLTELSNSTFGQHIRHTLEFFICLFDAENSRVVNYDQRKHDTLIETDKKLALSVIQSIHDFLDKNQDDFTLTFEANYAISNDVNDQMKSSFYRELAYNIEHAIHHMALLKVAVNHSLTYIELPENFGVASSTIRYRESTKAN
ncbi:DinB family protein [Ekhidna sp. To15]|uniref:DinB family protein n=1 Tax=Ekhidna sp. To15 TaxID=3395267 RepID=UPI003F52766D